MKNLNNKKDLIDQILAHTPSFYVGSQTSTVVPYHKIEGEIKSQLIQLSLPTTLNIDKSKAELTVSGGVTWKEARRECRAMGFDLMTAPTEDLATILAGIATSATGERAFGFGPLRDQIVSVTYLNYLGDEKTLYYKNDFPQNDYLKNYQNEYHPYLNFKNGPYPRYQRESDLLVGSEGQLGVIISATIKIIPTPKTQFMAIKVPSWREEFAPHLEIFQGVQGLRGKILSCEILDLESLSYLKPDERPFEEHDIIILEILAKEFDLIYETLLDKLKFTEAESIFSMDENKVHALRMSVPRAIFEANEKMGVSKKGTDVQVSAELLAKLLTYYQQLSRENIPSVLFGHFGDAHLHFNFMPTPKETEWVDHLFNDLYDKVIDWKGSPFAEHGVGLLKKQYIKKFYTKTQSEMFSYLKRQFDPRGQFFPEGFMSIKVKK